MKYADACTVYEVGVLPGVPSRHIVGFDGADELRGGDVFRVEGTGENFTLDHLQGAGRWVVTRGIGSVATTPFGVDRALWIGNCRG